MNVRNAKRAESGFTLVELLVVISIIALLLSILMPSLRAAREQAKTIVCQSNKHQLAIGFQLYLNDNNQFLPPRRPWPDFWPTKIGTYIGKNLKGQVKGLVDTGSVFKCPAMPKGVRTVSINYYLYKARPVSILNFTGKRGVLIGEAEPVEAWGWVCIDYLASDDWGVAYVHPNKTSNFIYTDLSIIRRKKVEDWKQMTRLWTLR